MANVVIMPKAGQSMTEGRIVAWLKKEGEVVGQGEPLLEIETDKANLEVEAPEGGILRHILVPEGEICSVLAPIGVIGGADEEIDLEALVEESASSAATPLPASPTGTGSSREPVPPASGGVRAPSPEPPAKARGVSPHRAPPTVSAASPPETAALRRAGRWGRGERRILASPLARRLASARGLDLSTLRGSGPGGRILRRDVESAAPPAATDGGAVLARLPAYPPPSPRPPAAVPFEGMRGAIARALEQSKSTIPHYYVTAAVDMTAALALKAEWDREGVRLTVNDLVLRACTLALLDEPGVNCRVFHDRIEYPVDIHLGIAVGSDEGLVVPVLLRAQDYDLEGLAGESRRVVTQAQQGKLIGSGQGTFTVSNLGMFGVESFTAIINPPEGAILAVGSAQEQLVPAAGGFFPRSILRLTLSSDHRAIDGLLAARFLARVRYWLEYRLGE